MRQSGGVSQPVFHRAKPLQSELNALVVVVVDLIVHALFECRDAAEHCKMLVLGFQGAEDALYHRAVKAVLSATHTLRDAMMRKHRSVQLPLALPWVEGFSGFGAFNYLVVERFASTGQ